MMKIRKAADRGRTHFDWLDSWHTFSFGQYLDPAHRGFSWLRVINDDIVAPGGGFPTHGHRDMEIITYVLSGALEHKDSLGSGSVIRPGDVQHMSAGTGIEHSEFNASPKEPVHLLQIWIIPHTQNVRPRYNQKNFPIAERQNKLRLVASGNGRDGSLPIYQDADMYVGTFDASSQTDLDLRPGRKAWAHVAKGSLIMNGQEMSEGDGMAVVEEEKLQFRSDKGGEILLFDLP